MLMYTRTNRVALERIAEAFCGIEFMAVDSIERFSYTTYHSATIDERIIYDLDEGDSVATFHSDVRDLVLITHRDNRHQVKSITESQGIRGMVWHVMPIAYNYKKNYAYLNGRGEIRFKIDRLKERSYVPDINIAKVA